MGICAIADGAAADSASALIQAQAQLPNGIDRDVRSDPAAAPSSHPSAAAESEQAALLQGQHGSRGQSGEPDQDAGQQPWSYSAEPSRAESMDLDIGPEARAHAPRPGSGRRPKYVTPVDELDNSDVESAQVIDRLLRSGSQLCACTSTA